MFKHILLATDGSERSESAIKTGIHLAKSLGAKVTGLTVVATRHRSGDVQSDRQSGAIADVDEKLLFIKIVANGNGVDCNVMLVHGDSPSEEIVRVAKELDCDLIVMASHGRKGLEALVIGSQTQKVLGNSHLPVLVCR